MAGNEPAIRAATALMADGINLKRRARGAIALKAEKAASVALDWLSNNTDGFVDATPQGACPELRFEMAAGAMLTSSKAYGRTDPPPAILGGGLDRDMAALTTSSPLKRREGELGDTSPHPAHSVHSPGGIEAPEYMDASLDGESLPPLSMEAAVAQAVHGPAAGAAAAVVIDADLVPDPEPSRTNSNVTVEAGEGSASAAGGMDAMDAYILDGIDDEEDGL